MRLMTLGVLVSAHSHAPACDARAALGTPERPSRTLDAHYDLASAADLLESISRLGHGARLIHVDDDFDLALRQHPVDACLLALHGTVGGTGDVQGLLTMRGVPFAGPGATATALAFDKIRCRQLLAYHNLPVPTSLVLGPDQELNPRALNLLGWPCLIKPRHGAHGVGVTHLRDAEAVMRAVDRALCVDHELILERAICGAEVQVVLLGERVLGSMQVERATGPEASAMVTPPQLSRVQLQNVHTLARRAVSALGLEESVTRVDVMVSDRHNELILEVEPLPPLHHDGVVARVARAQGMTHESLVAAMLERISIGTPHHDRGDAVHDPAGHELMLQ